MQNQWSFSCKCYPRFRVTNTRHTMIVAPFVCGDWNEDVMKFCLFFYWPVQWQKESLRQGDQIYWPVHHLSEICQAWCYTDQYCCRYCLPTEHPTDSLTVPHLSDKLSHHQTWKMEDLFPSQAKYQSHSFQ